MFATPRAARIVKTMKKSPEERQSETEREPMCYSKHCISSAEINERLARAGKTIFKRDWEKLQLQNRNAVFTPIRFCLSITTQT